MQLRKLKDDSSTSKYKKPMQMGTTKVNEIANITPTNPLHVGNMGENQSSGQLRRHYTDLGVPILLVFREAVKANYLKPLDARPPPNLLPKNYKANEYCEYHQGNGHKTEFCWTLKNKIQDLV